MTDTEYVAAYLRRHPSGACAIEIISASIRERGVGLTVHSRIADLRKEGYTIPKAEVEGQTWAGRPRYVYRLLAEPKAAAAPAEPEPSVEPLEQMVLA